MRGFDEKQLDAINPVKIGAEMRNHARMGASGRVENAPRP